MIVVVDTGVANRHSVLNALEFIGCPATLSADAAIIRAAAKLVVPGVGAFAAGMRALRERGLVEILGEQVVIRRVPVLGICLGMQMMATMGLEDGEQPGLDWLSGTVRRLAPASTELKVPHIGFNAVTPREDCVLFAGLPPSPDFYFVHSYHLDCPDELVTGRCDYGGPVVASVQRGNIFGVQFHPEKSQSNGLQLLRNFVEARI